ncbi:MAG: hypothetical protein WC467_01560 [Patescibacteria group bacterium]
MKKMKTIARWLMIIPLMLLLANCQKINEKDFGPGITGPPDDGSNAILKTSAAVTADTLKSLPDMVIKFWWEGLPTLPAGVSYQYTWNFGDGSVVLNTARVEHQYSVGVYQLTSTATNPLSGVIVTRSLWVKIAVTYVADNTIIVLGYAAVSGGYDYHLGFKASTVAGFQVPPYTANNVPFVTGTFCNWQINPPPSNPDYTNINGEIYLTRHFVFPNSSAQDLHFGQITNWSYNPNSKFWVSTGVGSGKYVIYPFNGQIYSFPPGVVYYPGEDGDAVGSIYPPTVRDSLLLGSTAATDSLRIFINYQQYANGSQPFLSFVHLNNWSNVALKMIDNTGWGYRTFAISSIKLDNNRLYFKFGPNLAAPTVYGDMTHSKFYDATNEMCGLQLATMKSSGKHYNVVVIK